MVAVPPDRAPALEQDLAPEAVRLGLLVIGAADVAGASSSTEVLHRHLLICCRTESDRALAPIAIRRLARASPRRHVLLWPAGSVVSAAGSAGSADTLTESYLRRAEQCFRRERPRGARIWLEAALAAANRRSCGSWNQYLDVALHWSDGLLATGRLNEADAWLSSLEVEAAIRGKPSASVRQRRARVNFWLVKAAEVPDGRDAGGADEIGWAAMAAWRDGDGNGDDERVKELRRELARLAGNEDAAVWSRILSALFDPDIGGAGGDRSGSSWRDLLLRGVHGRALLTAGRHEDARALLGDARGSEPEAELIRALKRQCDRHSANVPKVIGKTTVPGVRAFLLEKRSMVTVDGLERLLGLMESAPDEFAAATAGCAWVRQLAPDVKVGIFSADGSRMIAGCGWKRGDTVESVKTAFTVPIRQAASTIAQVVVGEGERAHLLREPAQALAMLAVSTVRACLDDLELRAADRDGVQDILGRSQAIVSVRTAIARAAATTFPVLIEGQSGTGKELAARAIHRLSSRRDRRFLAVNCAALTDELIEAELFGHARGAFTGAVGPRTGLFEEANGGTLFLDEVAELSPRAQAKLLRVLQEREVRRVGENGPRAIDVRVVSATNTPLTDASASGRFRTDLRFRLAVVSIHLPSLDERIEDIPSLAHVFWRRAMAETGKRAYLGPDAIGRLLNAKWPGNIRELQNVISALAVVAPMGGRVTARHVAEVLAGGSGAAAPRSAAVQSLDAARTVFERRHVAEALARHSGRRASTARALGLTRQGLAKTMRRLGLEEGPERGVA